MIRNNGSGVTDVYGYHNQKNNDKNENTDKDTNKK